MYEPVLLDVTDGMLLTYAQAYINLIQQWPGLSSPQDKSSEKVQTLILYDGEAPGNFKWGYQVENGTSCHQWFKLYVMTLCSKWSDLIDLCDRDLESTYDPKEKALDNRYPLSNRLPANVDQILSNLLQIICLRSKDTSCICSNFTWASFKQLKYPYNSS
jgi:hypothetical protein